MIASSPSAARASAHVHAVDAGRASGLHVVVDEQGHAEFAASRRERAGRERDARRRRPLLAQLHAGGAALQGLAHARGERAAV